MKRELVSRWCAPEALPSQPVSNLGVPPTGSPQVCFKLALTQSWCTYKPSIGMRRARSS